MVFARQSSALHYFRFKTMQQGDFSLSAVNEIKRLQFESHQVHLDHIVEDQVGQHHERVLAHARLLLVLERRVHFGGPRLDQVGKAEGAAPGTKQREQKKVQHGPNQTKGGSQA